MQLAERNRFRPTLEGLETRDVPSTVTVVTPVIPTPATPVIPTPQTPNITITVIPVVQINIAVLSTNVTQINGLQIVT